MFLGNGCLSVKYGFFVVGFRYWNYLNLGLLGEER